VGPTLSEQLVSLFRLPLDPSAVEHVDDIDLPSLAARAGRPLRIAVVRLDGIGDWVLSMPLIPALTGSEHVGSVTVVAPPAIEGLLRKTSVAFLPFRAGTILAPPAPGGLLGKVRAAGFVHGRAVRRQGRTHRGEFDLVIVPRWDTDLGINARMWAAGAGAPVVGFDPRTVPTATSRERREHRLLSRPVDQTVPAEHEIVHTQALIRALGLDDTVSCDFGRTVFGVDGARPADWSAPYLAVHTRANELKRQWPPERWRQLILDVLQTSDLQVALVGAPGDVSYLDRLRDGLGPRVRLATGFSLADLPGFFSGAEMFVGNDSGPAHMASVVGTPTLVVSPHPGDGDPAHRNSPVRFAPWGAHVTVLQPVAGLDRCSAGCSQARPHCITAVQVGDLHAAMRALAADTGKDLFVKKEHQA
jgi:ADP-heptose:LPS heptosyltransferase